MLALHLTPFQQTVAKAESAVTHSNSVSSMHDQIHPKQFRRAKPKEWWVFFRCDRGELAQTTQRSSYEVFFSVSKDMKEEFPSNSVYLYSGNSWQKQSERNIWTDKYIKNRSSNLFSELYSQFNPIIKTDLKSVTCILHLVINHCSQVQFIIQSGKRFLSSLAKWWLAVITPPEWACYVWQ